MRPTPSIFLAAALLTVACGGAGHDAPAGPGAPAPEISLAVSAASIDVTQGQSGSVTVAISRTNGYSGVVSLALEGAPAGVTATFDPPTLPGGTSSSLLTLRTTAAAATGTHALTVRASGTGVTARTAALAMNVAPAPPALSITTPADAVLPIGAAFSLSLTATGPASTTFSSVGAPLPDGLTLDPASGQLRGTPTPAALLDGSPTGVWAGIVIRVTSGSATADTEPFTLTVTGAPLPAPYAYMPFDGSDLGDAFGRAGTPIGNVEPGRPGAIGEAVFVGGTNSYIRYPSSLSSQLNGKTGFTLSTTIRTTSDGTMFFGLSDRFTHWSRSYAALLAGRIEFGGRSRNSDVEPFRAVVGNAPVNDGAFHTFVGVMDLPGDRLSIYLDGRLDATRTVDFAGTSFEVFTPADQNVVGHISTLADTPVAPAVTHDEMALWDRALDASQAATLAWLSRTGRSLRAWIGF